MTEIFDQLTRLAQTYPADRVGIWIHRRPNGAMDYTAVIDRNEESGGAFECSQATELETAVDELLLTCPHRDPRAMRQQKIAALEQELTRLKDLQKPPF